MFKHLPNSITLLRIVLIPVFLTAYYAPLQYGHLIAVGLFMLSGISDGVDGYLARRLNVTSEFGRFLDPLADKLIVSAAIIVVAVTYNHWLYTIAAALIIGRDTYVSGLREWAVHRNASGALQVSWWGKLKTFLQFISIAFLLYGGNLYGIDTKLIGDICLLLAALFSLHSMILYSYNLYQTLQNGKHDA